MEINLVEAKKLCSKDEWTWIDAAASKCYLRMNARELRDAIRVIRDVRNKYRDLEKMQRRKAKQRPKSSDSRDFFGDLPAVRTAQKSEIFAEVLECYEARLSALEGGMARDEASH